MVSGLHHFYKRKRIHQKHEKYPHPNKYINFMDKIIYFVAIMGPLMTFPQLWKIWVEQVATGVSIFTWVAYFLGSFFWLVYGVTHKEKPIIITNILWVILTIAIVVGIWMYG